MYHILVIDDEQSMRDVISEILSSKDYHVWQAAGGEQGLRILQEHHIDLVICDMKMSPINGMEVLKKAKGIKPEVLFIMITAYGTIENAVECMRQGAHNYILKPFKINELRFLVQRALKYKELQKENISLKEQLREKYKFRNIVGKSPFMQKVYELMEKVARTDSTVLISGASGTGKELVARAIHHQGSRRDKPFIAVNCGGLPESLLESELFGHVRGSFTGAIKDKEGLFQAASGGTIFLDEISATGSAIQVKLLRVLQEKEIKIVGDTKSVHVDARVIAATNRDLMEEVKEGRFREDLYYRLSVIPVMLPLLRERMEDIPLLTQHFLKKHVVPGMRNQKTISPEALDLLIHYSWPGNVRELENTIERAITLSEGPVILPRDFPDNLISGRQAYSDPQSRCLKDIIREKEREVIKSVLIKANGDKKKAAKILDIDLATLYRKL